MIRETEAMVKKEWIDIASLPPVSHEELEAEVAQLNKLSAAHALQYNFNPNWNAAQRVRKALKFRAEKQQYLNKQK